MDNNFVRSASDYSDLRLPHYEDGYYDIISIERSMKTNWTTRWKNWRPFAKPAAQRTS